MSKTQKELAFLRDFSVATEWTERFTSLADKHLKPPEEGDFLYFNAGTGSHVLALQEKLDNQVSITCVCENAETQKIAEAKVAAMMVKVNFARLEDLKPESFDYVLADLSFTAADKISDILDELVYLTKKGGEIAFFTVTAASFGEIFSYLWESFLEVDLIEKSGEIERLINQIPTISELENLAKEAGLKKIEVETRKEVFDYDNGKELAGSTLVNNFFFPVWLNFLKADEQKKVIKQLSKIIDNDLEKLTARFSVKATLIEGQK